MRIASIVRPELFAVVTLFVVFGVSFIIAGSAQTVVTTAEAETGILSSGANRVDDAAASGGKAVKFNLASPSPAPASIYWGALMSGSVYGGSDAPWSSSTWDTFEQNAGKKVSLVNWGQAPPWEADFMTSAFNLVNARGAISFHHEASGPASLAAIANGQYDDSIIRWAQAAKAFGRPFFFRWNWEMNGDWYSWGQQAKAKPDDFVNSWRHFHDIVRQQGANNVTWVWCPNVDYQGGTPLTSLYPGDAYVDWTCMDGYNTGTNPLKPQGWHSFTQVMKPTYDQLLSIAPGKPIIIAETAATEYGGSKAAWIANMLKTELPNTFPKIKGVSWFNWNVNENGGIWDYPIESSSAAQAAFKDGISSPYYKTNDYGDLPLLTKVPVP